MRRTGWLIGLAALGVAGAASAASATGATPAEPVPAASAEPQAIGLLVPAYSANAAVWDALARAARRVPLIATLNPASGPGPAHDRRYDGFIAALQAAGGRAVGYVATGYGERDQATVLDEVAAYFLWYPGLDGIFFDEVANDADAAHLRYYAHLAEGVRRQKASARILHNPGTNTSPLYLHLGDVTVADIANIFENRAEAFAGWQPSPWTRNVAPEHFAALGYAEQDPSAITNWIEQAAAKGVGWVYVTDDDLPNPWDRLPSYWSAEVDAVARLNAGDD